MIVALLDAGDRAHERCVALAERTREPLVVSAATLVEVDYWGAQAVERGCVAHLREDIACGAYLLEATDERDLMRTPQLEE